MLFPKNCNKTFFQTGSRETTSVKQPPQQQQHPGFTGEPHHICHRLTKISWYELNMQLDHLFEGWDKVIWTDTGKISSAAEMWGEGVGGAKLLSRWRKFLKITEKITTSE